MSGPQSYKTGLLPSGANIMCRGYFPFHEDPATRVNQTHPFNCDENHRSRQSVNAAAKAPKTAPSHLAPMASTHVTEALQVQSNNVLVTSYIPGGLHGASLPMGKYYPSNYERRSRQQTSRMARSTAQATSYSDNTPAQNSRSDGDVRERLQQYQRDMIAQATLATRKLMLDGTPEATRTFSGFASHGLPISAPPTVNPASPRLRPLGSPGPVTPMELGGSGSSYLEVRNDPTAPDMSARERERRTPISPGGRIRAETRSPAATPAC
jgi:hypothetical protein